MLALVLVRAPLALLALLLAAEAAGAHSGRVQWGGPVATGNLTAFPSCSATPAPVCSCGKPGKGLCYGCHACNSCSNCNRCSTCVCDKPGGTGCETPPPAPPTPLPPPADWQPLINRSAMVYSGLAVLDQGLPLYPAVANGYLGMTLGCFKTDGINEGPTATAGVIHVAGVFNGRGTNSRRAELPGLHSVFPTSASSSASASASATSSSSSGGGGVGVVFAGAALDLEKGVFYNRTRLNGCGGAILEQRWYAHQAHRSLLVHEVELLGGTWAGDGSCVIAFGSCNVAAPSSVHTNATGSPPAGTAALRSTTLAPETPTTPLTTVGRPTTPSPRR